MAALTVRLFFLCGWLLLFAGPTFGQGDYQRTKDGKTFVWNADPKPGEAAAWFGDRDSDGYSSGVGTLTWYTSKGNVYARYFGNMVHGKFNGPVNVHSNGKTEHAIFVDGQRTTRWGVGPAPSRTVAENRLTPAKREVVAKAQKGKNPPSSDYGAASAQPASALEGVRRGQSPKPNPELLTAGSPAGGRSTRPNPKAETPTSNSDSFPEQTPNSRPSTLDAQDSAAEPLPPAEAPDDVNRRPNYNALRPQASQKPEAQVDDSLRSLVRPPSSLRSSPEAAVSPETEATSGGEKPETATSSEPNEHLTEEEAIALADAEARAQGYHLDEYQRPIADYSSVNDKWSLFYDQRPVGDVPEIRKYFTVKIDGKTKKTLIEPAP